MTTTLTPRAPQAVGLAPEAPSASAHGPTRMAGGILAVGVLSMLVGAGLYSSTGADLWGALSNGTIPAYLGAATDHRSTLFANLVFWTFGATALAVGGVVLARAARPVEGPGAVIARYAYQLGGTLAVVSFVTWMGLVRVAGAVDVATAELVGFAVTRLDDLATLSLIGVGPVLLALVSNWMPLILRRAAAVVGVAAALSVLALFTDASTSYGFAIVPLGLLWTLAAAVTAIRARP